MKRDKHFDDFEVTHEDDRSVLQMVVIQFAQDLSLRFEMTDYLACHFERIARNLSSLYSAIHSNRTTSLQILTLSDSVKKYKGPSTMLRANGKSCRRNLSTPDPSAAPG
jgi:hypothetical protein